MAGGAKKPEDKLGNAADKKLPLPSQLNAMPAGDFPILQPAVFNSVSEQVKDIANRDCAVIIKAETGTAKETLARQIHLHSRRARKPFIPVNCSVLRGKILQKQLFGRIDNSHDGEQTKSIGSFRAADGGTVFLDEIDKLNIDSQAKVLHVIQKRFVQPCGSNERFDVNVRIICATDQDLSQAVQDGRFMSDLYLSLNAATIELPPLRKRPGDIAILAEYFLDLHAQMYNEPAKQLEPSAVRALTEYTWPGNERELTGVMERAFVMSCSNKITVRDLPPEIISLNILASDIMKMKTHTADDKKRKLLIQALEKTKGRKMAAAKLLQIDRRKLGRLIKKYDLETSTFEKD